VKATAVREVLGQVATHLSDFVNWPEKAVLLWQGCDRSVPVGAKQRYHLYPDPIRLLAVQHGIRLDTRANGPATAAYLLAWGIRPERFGSSNRWAIHHLYSGKFPYVERSSTTHAAKDGNHFTQSAGLVAIHPIADALCDEFPFFSWLLRAEAFRRFGYDPDGVFSSECGELGFASGHGCEVVVSAVDVVTAK